jgi:hypothetical protein
MKRNEQVFRSRVTLAMAQLLRAFPRLTVTDVAAVFGNAGHESNGFTTMQEVKPTVENSRGGWGWFQWTGPRRRNFEAFAKRRKLDPAGDEAQMLFLIHELRTSEKATIPALQAATTLQAKVIAFEQAFERAGVKHYKGRQRWARIALDQWNLEQSTPAARVPAAVVDAPLADPVPPAEAPADPVKPWWHEIPILRQIVNTGAALGITGTAALDADWRTVAVIGGVVVLAVSAWAIHWQLTRRKPKVAA